MKRAWVKAVPRRDCPCGSRVQYEADTLWALPGWVPEVRKMGILPLAAKTAI